MTPSPRQHRGTPARLTATAAAALALSASAQPVRWDGDAGDGFWGTGANWDNDSVPGVTADVTIPGDAGEVSIVLSAWACASLNCESALRLTSGSLEVSGTGSASNVTFDGGGFAPTIYANGVFTISGAGSSTTGQALGTGTFKNAGTFTAPGFGLNIPVARNDGTWDMSTFGSDLQLSGTTAFTNAGGMAIGPESTVRGTGTLINAGTLAYSGGSGLAYIDSAFNQTGGVTAVSGVNRGIDIRADGWQITGGELRASAGGAIYLGGTNTPATRTLRDVTLEGDGAIEIFASNQTIDWEGEVTANVSGVGARLYAGTHNIEGELANRGRLELRAAVVSGLGFFTNESSGRLVIPTGNAAALHTDLTNNGTVDVFGTLYLNDAQLDNASGAAVNLKPGSSIATQTPGTPGELKSASEVSFRGSTAGETASIAVPVRLLPGSTLGVYSSTVNLSAGGTVSGGLARLDAEDFDATIRIESGTYAFTGPFTFEGPEEDKNGNVHQANGWGLELGSFLFGGPTFTISAATSVGLDVPTEFRAGTLGGPGTVFNESGFSWDSGAIACTFRNNAALAIGAGGNQSLSGTLENLFSVGQSGSIWVDGGEIRNTGLDARWSIGHGASITSSPNGGTLINEASISVSLGETPSAHEISVGLDNRGTIFVRRHTLFLTGGVLQLNETDGTLSGGTWITADGGRILFPRSLRRITGNTFVRGSSDAIPGFESLESIEAGAAAELVDTLLNGPLQNDGGEVVAEGHNTVTGDYTAKGGSQTTVQPGSTLEATGDMNLGETDSAADDLNPIAVIARGPAPPPSVIAQTLHLHGSLTADRQLGVADIGIRADLVIHPTGTIRVGARLDGTGIERTDAFTIEGAAALAGTLVITEHAGTPGTGVGSATILSAHSIAGTFDAIDAPCHYTVAYTPTEVRLVYSPEACSCAADLAPPIGVLDIDDVLAFLGAFASGDPLADLADPAGVLNIDDVLAFLTSFAAGCP